MKKGNREVREVHLDLADHKLAKLAAVKAGITIGAWLGAAVRAHAVSTGVAAYRVKEVIEGQPVVVMTSEREGAMTRARQMTVDELLAREAEKEGEP